MIAGDVYREPRFKGPPSGAVDTGGGGSDDGGMEHRLTALETRLDTILPTLATKADIGDARADLHKVDASISRWILATVITIVTAIAAATIALLNKPATAPAPPQSIIIQLPPQPTPAPPPK